MRHVSTHLNHNGNLKNYDHTDKILNFKNYDKTLAAEGSKK